jgi:uncharacterized protein with HEPN domain
MKDDKLYLIHITECIERIESYVSEIDKSKFLASTLIQDAVIRNLQVLAESTQRLSDKLKNEYSQIHWYKISGFRNILVHDYLGVDLEHLWNIIQNELPALKDTISKILK